MSIRDMLRGNRTLVLGLVLAAILVTIALIGPLLFSSDPNAINVATRFQGPSASHPLGTDDLGRDTLVRLIYGARMSLFIAVVSAALGTVLGQVIGLVSGYLGGWVDVFMMRVVDLFFAIPTLLVAIGIVALFGASATTTILALGIAYTP
jgi:ABC-type dipeptide/oligopeptide/nickel transport system permease subunit